MSDPIDNNSTGEAMDCLAEENRVLVEARMLPEGRSLSGTEVAAVREHFKAYIVEAEIKLGAAAKEIGYSNGSVSEWSNGKYGAKSDELTRAVNAWIERHARARAAKRPGDFVKTRVAETIKMFADQADKRTMMAAIVAPAGSGKTKLLKVLAEQMRGHYFYCDQDVSKRGLLHEIAVELGFRNTSFT